MPDVRPDYQALHATVNLRTIEGKAGTGMVVRKGRLDFLVTAAHGVLPSDVVDFQIGSVNSLGFKELKLERVDEWEASSPDDVAVFKLSDWQGTALPVDRLDMNGISLAQDVLIIGYPDGTPFVSKIAGKPEGLPAPNYASIPMVKHGILAAVDSEKVGNTKRLYLDLVANPGFSGGPVLFRHRKTDQTLVAGMVIQTARLATDQADDADVSPFVDISTAVPADLVLKHIP